MSKLSRWFRKYNYISVIFVSVLVLLMLNDNFITVSYSDTTFLFDVQFSRDHEIFIPYSPIGIRVLLWFKMSLIKFKILNVYNPDLFEEIKPWIFTNRLLHWTLPITDIKCLWSYTSDMVNSPTLLSLLSIVFRCSFMVCLKHTLNVYDHIHTFIISEFILLKITPSALNLLIASHISSTNFVNESVRRLL